MTTVNKPDLNGPRFRNKRISVMNISTYKKFKEKHPAYKDISLERFKNIIRAFNLELTKGVINNRNGVELPEGLGFVFMGVCQSPKTRNNIDFKTSIETGVKTTFKNWASDNKLLKIFYTNHNTKYPFQNKQVWSFKAVKKFRSEASNTFKDNWSKYIEVSPDAKISAMFDRRRKREYVKNLKPVIPEDYNEFKI